MMEHRKYRELIASSAIISIVSFILVSVSFFSQQWIKARGTVVNKETEVYVDSIITYGLFEGKLIRSLLLSPKIYSIHFTCVWEANLCAWSCLNDQDTRSDEVKALIEGKKPAFSCQPLMTSMKSILISDSPHYTNGTVGGELLNAGINLSGILLVILTVISLFICAGLGILNYEKCPRTEILNLPGIILSSLIAFVFNLAGLVVYGCNYDYWIKENIGILDTITGEYKSYANLGFGYWLFMGACILNPISIFVLYIRTILLKMRDRTETVVIVARVNDPTTVLY